MPYVKRDEDGKIISESPVMAEDDQEYLPKENEEVFEFTKDQIEKGIGRPLNWRDSRKHAFPSPGDQVDAIAKTFKYMWDNGVDIGPDGEVFIKQLRDVKNKFPKD
jgi:hypothetical protein